MLKLKGQMTIKGDGVSNRKAFPSFKAGTMVLGKSTGAWYFYENNAKYRLKFPRVNTETNKIDWEKSMIRSIHVNPKGPRNDVCVDFLYFSL